MTVADDLATLRETVWEIAGCGDIRFSHDIDRAKAEHDAALDCVEAEIARLEQQVATATREANRRQVSINLAEQRAEAAEAEAARLRDGLRRIANPHDSLAGVDDSEFARALLAEDSAAHQAPLGSDDMYPESAA